MRAAREPRLVLTGEDKSRRKRTFIFPDRCARLGPDPRRADLNPEFYAYDVGSVRRCMLPREFQFLVLFPEAIPDPEAFGRRCLNEAVWRTSQRSVILGNPACPVDLGYLKSADQDDAFEALFVAESDDHDRMRRAGIDSRAVLNEDWVAELRANRPRHHRPFVPWDPSNPRKGYAQWTE